MGFPSATWHFYTLSFKYAPFFCPNQILFNKLIKIFLKNSKIKKQWLYFLMPYKLRFKGNVELWWCHFSVAKQCLTLLQHHGLQPARLLCPWDFPGKNTRVHCHFLLQGIFLTQKSNPCLPDWQADSSPLRHQGSPLNFVGHAITT